MPSRARARPSSARDRRRGDHHGLRPWCSSRWRLPSLVGLLNNPYAGLVVFVALPALFVFGLLLIPLGMWLQRAEAPTRPGAAADWAVVDFRKPTVRRAALVIIALTAVNLVILLRRRLRHAALDGIAVVLRAGVPHADAPAVHGLAGQRRTRASRCADCHIGEGAAAFVHYKLVGVRQLYHVMTGQIPRPIPGVADMRPALEICGNCHWPERGCGDRVRVIREFADDETNSETTTRSADARRRTGTADRRGPRDSLARRPDDQHHVRRDRQGPPDDSLRQGDRRARAGRGNT